MQQRLPAFAPRDKHDGLAKAAQRPLPQDPRLVRAQKSARSGEKEEGEVSDDEPELQIVVGISRGAGRSSQDHGRDVCHKRSEQIGGAKKLEVVTLLSSSEDDDDGQPAGAGKRQRVKSPARHMHEDAGLPAHEAATGDVVKGRRRVEVQRSDNGADKLECWSCKRAFTFSEQERQRLLAKGVQSMPKTCRPCRMGNSAVVDDTTSGLCGNRAREESAPSRLSASLSDRSAERKSSMPCAGTQESDARSKKVPIPRKKTPPIGSSGPAGEAVRGPDGAVDQKLGASRHPASLTGAERNAGGDCEDRILIPD